MPATPVLPGRSLALCAALGLACLFAATPACYLSAKPKASQRGVVRVVAPGKVAEPYFGSAPGGRFAVFADAIVDLPNARVTWRSLARVYLAFSSRPHMLLREATGDIATDKRAGIELWSALNGRVEAAFSGAPLWHSDLAGLMPLQDLQTLLIVDTIEPREVLRTPMTEEALSAVMRRDELLVLSRRKGPWPSALALELLTLQTFQWPSGAPKAKHVLKVDWRGHQPKPASEDRSPPFLHLDAEGGLGVGRLFRRSAEPAQKTELYRVAIAAAARVQPASWTITPFAWPEGGTVASLANAGARPIPSYEPPANVRDALSRLPLVAMGGLADAQGALVLTHGEGYLCMWSLRAARREACLRVKHADAGLEPDARAWLRQENERVGTWSLAQGLQWQGKTSATDVPSRESARTPLDCQLSARADPGTSAIAVGDTDGPRFFLYDMGPDAWLIALPDGHYVGSPDAEKKLAFYDEKGALLANEAVTAARDAQRVVQVLSSAIDCPR